MKRLTASLALAMLMTLCLATATFAATAPQSQASKAATASKPAASVIPFALGGCAEHAVAGFEMGVCISNRNTVNTVYPDVYVNQQAAFSSCQLFIEIWDNGGNKDLQAGPYSCVLGHYQGGQLVFIGGCLTLHASAWISKNGTFYRIGDSPSFTFCN